MNLDHCPDLIAEGELICPCGEFRFGFTGPAWLGGLLLTCPHCGRTAELWPGEERK